MTANKEQLAHELALAKISGSNMQTREFIATYREYYNDFLSALEAEPAPKRKNAEIRESPF